MPCPHLIQGNAIKGELHVLLAWQQGWVYPAAAAQRFLPNCKSGSNSAVWPEIGFRAFSHLVTCTHIVSIAFMTFQTKSLSPSTLL